MNKTQQQKTYYITTPIYFSSAEPHIGAAYTTIAADTMARYKKARGYAVKFLTGTDEHGQKMEQAAFNRGLSPQQHVDKMAELYKAMSKAVGADYDFFWRTSDPRHHAAVKKIFKKLYDQGDIYKGTYEGWYCTPCETFYTEMQLVMGMCPDCGRAVEKMQEESYFFRLSKYQDRLVQHLEENPEFIMPLSRRNEMVNNFIKPGLEDLCVSRTSVKWGISVDFDPAHVVYVWLDALSNYANALGFMSEDDSLYQQYWPADVHVVGKEIMRFHSIIWPIILMALEQPLPKQIFGHGWLTVDGRKMSKSVGNVIDPHLLVSRYGVDATRYFLLREFVFGQDGDFKYEALLQRMNADLANDLGNLLSRTVGMIEKYFGGSLPDVEIETSPFDTELESLCQSLPAKVEAFMDKLNFNEALSEIWQVIRRANKYTDENQPWVLCKDEAKQGLLANVLYHLAETLRIVAIMVQPIMPNIPAQIYTQLNFAESTDLHTWESAKQFGLLPRNVSITKGPVLFPRMDIAKELEALQSTGRKIRPVASVEDETPQISIDDFAKVELKVGEVLECEAIEGTRLLKSQVRVGADEVRQIVSGIAQFYEPAQMLGKKVVIVTNLKPATIRGVRSEGMLLAASQGKGKKEVLALVTLDRDIENGAGVR